MEMKLASLSVATALDSMVLPHPGGPKRRIPFGGLIPTLVNTSGFFIGHSTASCSSCFTSVSPPTSAQLTEGTSMYTSRMAVGVISPQAVLESFKFARIVLRHYPAY